MLFCSISARRIDRNSTRRRSLLAAVVGQSELCLSRFSRSRFKLLSLFSLFGLFGLLDLGPFGAHQVHGDVIGSFKQVGGTPDEEFGWDDFGLNGEAYEGPHLPDQFGDISNITANSGGLITTTNNLYSFTTVPNWSVNLDDLNQDLPFTSLVVQFAASATYDGSQFTLGGNVPNEFLSFDGPEIGGFPYTIYWAEWQGLSAASSYSVTLAGTGQHQSLAGAQASYFNSSDSSFDITAVPEPGSAGLLLVASALMLVRRRRR